MNSIKNFNCSSKTDVPLLIFFFYLKIFSIPSNDIAQLAPLYFVCAQYTMSICAPIACTKYHSPIKPVWKPELLETVACKLYACITDWNSASQNLGMIAWPVTTDRVWLLVVSLDIRFWKLPVWLNAVVDRGRFCKSRYLEVEEPQFGDGSFCDLDAVG